MSLMRDYRKAMGMTQKQLAEELNANLGTKYQVPDISRIENEQYSAPEKVLAYINSKIDEKPFANPCGERKNDEWVIMPTAEISSLKSAVLQNEGRKAMTQGEKILEYINDFGSITTWDAFMQLGITRLASRIHDLSDEGYQFDRKVEKAKNRYGEPIHYTRYSLRDDDGKAYLD